MKYRVSLSEDETYVSLQVFEAITSELASDFSISAISLARENQLNKYLVDARGVPNISSSTEQYLLDYNKVAEYGLDKGARIALLIFKHDTSHYFIETVFTNAGYQCQSFHDKDSALAWLKSNI
jgi:hypothetical protein